MPTKSTTDVQAKILFLIEKDNGITISALSEVLEINQSAVQRHIEQMKDAEILKREGGRSAGKWVVMQTR